MAQPHRAAKHQVKYEEISDDDNNFNVGMDWSKLTAKPPPRTYTLDDLNSLIKEDCPEEFALIPNINTLTFKVSGDVTENLPTKLTCDARLRFGDIDSSIPANRARVYMYIGGEGNNRISLVADVGTEVIHHTNVALTQPIKPFWYLCSHGRILDEAEMRRVKTLTCYLLLAAGHIQTVQYYRDFEEHLKDAMVWYGRGVEAYTKDKQDGQMHEHDGVHRSVSARRSYHDQGTASPVRRGVSVVPIQEREEADGELQPPKKRTKYGDIASRMRRQYKKLGHDIACYEKEISTIRANAKSVAELTHKVSAQRDEIIKLSEEVNNARASNQTMEVTVKKQADELKRLITDMNCQRQELVTKDQQIVQAEKMRKAEEEKRLVAEKELDERRDAQKRMAAMFSELAK